MADTTYSSLNLVDGQIKLGSTTLTEAELGVADAVTAGLVTASKIVVVDSNRDIGDFRNVDAVNFDAGASGIAGSYDIFPATASRGKVALTAANSTGDTTTTLVNASQAAARIYTIPDAGTDASFLMTEGAQTINGVQTYTLPRVADHNTTITAFSTGGQASATALAGEWNNVTTVAANFDSVKLPTAVAGQVITVKNSGANILSVFPATSDAINALAANLSVDIPVSGEMTFRAIDATTWETCEVFSSPAPTTQKGNLVIKAADSAGNTQTLITNASQAAARTYTIPDAGASASFVMTGTAAQTIAGDLTVSGTLTNGAYTQTATNIDAGASGTAGSIDVFPPTGSKGKIAITAADSAGDTTTSITNASQAAARIYTIPDAGADANFVLTKSIGAVLGARCTTQIDAVTGTTGTTLTNITGMSVNVLAAGVYVIDAHFTGTSTANSGLKLAISGNATATSISVTGKQFNGTTMNASSIVTGLDSAVAAATTVFTDATMRGTIVVNAAGTITAQFAQNAAHADVTSIFVNSSMTLTRIA